MDLLEFIDRFPTENECMNHFLACRTKAGVHCKKCGSDEMFWILKTSQYKCRQCGNNQSIKVGTVMEHSNLPIKHWFITIFLLSSREGMITAEEIQDKLGSGESSQIRSMLQNLKFCFDKLDSKNSFDELLYLAVSVHHLLPLPVKKETTCLARYQLGSVSTDRIT